MCRLSVTIHVKQLFLFNLFALHFWEGHMSPLKETENTDKKDTDCQDNSGKVNTLSYKLLQEKHIGSTRMKPFILINSSTYSKIFLKLE